MGLMPPDHLYYQQICSFISPMLCNNTPSPHLDVPDTVLKEGQSLSLPTKATVELKSQIGEPSNKLVLSIL